MPRRRKDQQAPVAAPGQAYGENQDQIQAQNVIPLPQRNGVPPEANAPQGPPTAPGVPNTADGMAAALAAATGTPPPQGGLGAPSQRPTEPVTAGLNSGPGPGPEALGPSRARAGTVADTFTLLADLTGRPEYRQLAANATQQGI